MKKVYSTGEIAKLCGVAPRTVAEWIDTGTLGGYRVPGTKKRHVPHERLLRFLRAAGMAEVLKEVEAPSTILLAGLGPALGGRLTEALSAAERLLVHVASNLFEVGLALHHPPAVAVVDLSIGGRDEVRRAVAKLVEDCRRVLVLLPEDAPSFLGDAYAGAIAVGHPVDAGRIVALVQEASR